jgi:4-azaleucine resistance transporter AzlC
MERDSSRRCALNPFTRIPKPVDHPCKLYRFGPPVRSMADREDHRRRSSKLAGYGRSIAPPQTADYHRRRKAPPALGTMQVYYREGHLNRSNQPSSPLHEFSRGVRDQLPILLGVAPFGLIFGALAVEAGIPVLESAAFSLLIFAGSAQFIAVGMVREGTPSLIVVGTIFVVNMRHFLYSANLGPFLEKLSKRWRIVLSWLLTDEAFAVTSARFRQTEMTHAHWYMLGTGLTLWATWQTSTIAGILIGAAIPPSWPLDFALPLTFLALLAPALTDRPSWLSAMTAGVLAVFLADLPYRMGLLIAAVAGILVGILTIRRSLAEESPEGVR